MTSINRSYFLISSGCTSLKLTAVSAGKTISLFPVYAVPAVPAPAPATAPIAAPLPPPARPPIRAPSPAPPQFVDLLHPKSTKHRHKVTAIKRDLIVFLHGQNIRKRISAHRISRLRQINSRNRTRLCFLF